MKAVRRVAPLASPIKSDLLKVMLFIIISPYLFSVVATAFASTSADSTMPIVFKNLFDFILFIMRIRSFSNSCCPAYVLIIGIWILPTIELAYERLTLLRKRHSCKNVFHSILI